MNESFEVMLEDASAGKIQVSHRGLYYYFSARCAIPDSGVYRIVACWKDGWYNLGIPLPEEDGFVLKKQIAAAHFPEHEMGFVLIPANEDPERYLTPGDRSSDPAEAPLDPGYAEDLPDDIFSDQNMSETGGEVSTEHDRENKAPDEYVRLHPDEPFPEMERLVEGCFVIWEGGPAIKFREEETQTEMDSPTGQWSEPVMSE